MEGMFSCEDVLGSYLVCNDMMGMENVYWEDLENNFKIDIKLMVYIFKIKQG